MLILGGYGVSVNCQMRINKAKTKTSGIDIGQLLTLDLAVIPCRGRPRPSTTDVGLAFGVDASLNCPRHVSNRMHVLDKSRGLSA